VIEDQKKAETEKSQLLAQAETTRQALLSVVEDQKEVEAERTQLLVKAEAARRTLLSVVEDQKRAERKVRQLNADLEQRVSERTASLAAANKELEAFSYSVSHDLRAPLRSIDGFSRILQEDYAAQLDHEAQNSLTRVRAAAQRMAQLIDDLLRLSRVTRSELQTVAVDLTALAGEAVATLHPAGSVRPVRWTIAPGLAAEGDPRLLRIVLDNLLGNAWKFTGPQPEAHIEFGQAATERGPAFFVRDNGAGFDMAYAGKLFGAFQRMHTMAEFPGTGIGLATVQRIIHRHGGHVWAESAVGQGATFYFTLGGSTAGVQGSTVQGSTVENQKPAR
jgi:light-regulated signal transduction histidine kinase (bacteriophytochrome)